MSTMQATMTDLGRYFPHVVINDDHKTLLSLTSSRRCLVNHTIAVSFQIIDLQSSP